MKTIKVIDLLNKIANGEINEDIKVEYQYGFNYEYCTIREFFDRYIVDKENLNQEITLEDIPKEDKKIKKVNTYVLCDTDFHSKGNFSLKATEIIDKAFEEYSNKINEIIDKINGE